MNSQVTAHHWEGPWGECVGLEEVTQGYLPAYLKAEGLCSTGAVSLNALGVCCEKYDTQITDEAKGQKRKPKFVVIMSVVWC